MKNAQFVLREIFFGSIDARWEKIRNAEVECEISTSVSLADSEEVKVSFCILARLVPKENLRRAHDLNSRIS